MVRTHRTLNIILGSDLSHIDKLEQPFIQPGLNFMARALIELLLVGTSLCDAWNGLGE